MSSAHQPLAANIGAQIAALPSAKALSIQIGRRDAIIAENSARAARNRGVSYAGLTVPLMPVPTARDMVAAATASAERAGIFQASPQGRFYAACVNIGKAGAHPSEAHRALAAYGRGFSSAAEIECAREALSEIAGPDADEARRALDEIAGSSLLMAAE